MGVVAMEFVSLLDAGKGTGPETGAGYFAGPTNCGLIWKGKRALLVDSGLDESAARKILRYLKEQGLELTGILNTHFHADHVGGNAFLVQRTGSPVFAPAVEAEFVRQPILEPASLYGMAAPPASLRNKFLMAQPTPCVQGLEPGSWQDPLGLGMEPLDVSGHSPGQLALAVTGGVLFAGDLFFGSQVLDKHGIPYNSDVGKHLQSLARAQVWAAEGRFAWMVPGHGPACRPGEALRTIEENRQRVEDLLFHICYELKERGPLSAPALVAALCYRFGRQLDAMGEFLLMQSAVQACLSHLAVQGLVGEVVAENQLLWRNIERTC
ncbi:MAG TPA: MBL fold metallo-hydrolase [Firmicutes bacterium]|nr:MBL fold metallo-hydrolase [Bacillota bacterium]